MHIATEFICIIFEVLMIHLYLSYSFTKKAGTLTVILFNLLYFTGLSILSFIDNMAFARLLFTFIAIVIMSYTLYKCKRTQSFLYSTIYCVFIIVTDVLTSTIFIICNIDTEQMLRLGSGRSLFLIIGHIALFISFSLLISIKPLMTLPYSLKEFVNILPCTIITGLLCYILTSQYIFNGIEIPALYIIVLLGMLYTNVYFLFFIHSLHTKAIEKQEYELSKQHFLMQQNYYDQLHNQQESVRSLWHDLNKYISAAQFNSYASIDELEKQLEDINPTIDTNNRIINVILNEYMHHAKEIDTDINFDINVPDTLPMIATDLYIVLGNSFDNALDALTFVDIPNRKLDMKLKYQNNILYYELSNPFVDVVTIAKDKKIHGYGIKNIRKIADKYNGTVIINKENNIFTISAHFNF